MHNLTGTVLNQPGWSSGIVQGSDDRLLLLTPLVQGRRSANGTVLPNAGSEYRLLHLPTMRQWTIRSPHTRVQVMCATPDAGFALTRERGAPRPHNAIWSYLSRWPAVEQLSQRRQQQAQIVLYTRPGTPIAFLPVQMSEQQFR